MIGGRVAYEAISLVLQSLIIGGLAFLLGARFGGGPLGFAVLVLSAVLLGAAFSALSDASALVLRQRESVIGLNSFLVLPLTFLSAAFLPLALVPDWIATAGPDQPGQLGRRGRPGGAARRRRLELHRAAARRAGRGRRRLPRARDARVPELPAVGLTPARRHSPLDRPS